MSEAFVFTLESSLDTSRVNSAAAAASQSRALRARSFAIVQSPIARCSEYGTFSSTAQAPKPSLRTTIVVCRDRRNDAPADFAGLPASGRGSASCP